MNFCFTVSRNQFLLLSVAKNLIYSKTGRIFINNLKKYKYFIQGEIISRKDLKQTE